MAELPPINISSGDIPSEAKSDDTSAGIVGMSGCAIAGPRSPLRRRLSIEPGYSFSGKAVFNGLPQVSRP